VDSSGTDPAYTYGGGGNRRKKVDSSGTTWYNFSGINVISEEDAGPDGGSRRVHLEMPAGGRGAKQRVGPRSVAER